MQRLVPTASEVTAPAHHHVPAALSCPHTGSACPALAALFSDLTPATDEASAWLRSLAPCSDCRVAFAAGCEALRRLRLGQREREILCATKTGPFTVTEPGMSRSLSAARRRAALSLGKAGLVQAFTPSVAGKPGPARATVALTDLGRYVMLAYGRFIETGKAVRWTRPARGAVLPGQEPQHLVATALARTEAALRDTLAELKGVLVAAISRQFKDPGKLDEVARHLERKASLLRAVLEPARVARAAQPQPAASAQKPSADAA